MSMNWIYRSSAFAVVGIVFCCCVLPVVLSTTSEVTRPRGVALSKAPLYRPSGGDRSQFVCLDGLKTIRFDQVNDDFCDCADSSDEPGTAACPNGLFHCTNAGFRSLRIPSSRVNDGVCDCCDASDEYGPEMGGRCVNDCNERGKEDLLREKQKAELARQGSQLKAEMATKGQAKKAEQAGRLDELKRSFAEAESLVAERDAIKREAEALEKEALDVYRAVQEAEKRERTEREAQSSRHEAEETFRKFDSNADGRVDIPELQTRISFDRNRDGEVSLDEARYFLDEQDEANLDAFVNVCWPRIKPFLMLDSGLFKPPATVEEVAEERGEEDEHHLDDAQEHLPEEGEEGGDEEEEYEEETGEGEVEAIEPEDTAPIEYDDDTKLLIEQANGARNLYMESDRELREIKTEIANIEQLLEKDYGLEEEFASLHGECFNFEDREYVYKVCPFDRAVQQPRSGGAETRLGSWDKWAGRDPKNVYTTMLFANGAACWNGPQRSMHVHLECGLTTQVLSVAEPNRCEYVATMQTPAVCLVKDAAQAAQAHDEL